MNRKIWRLIESGPGKAWENMAVDEALFLEYEKDPSPGPVLRLYSWISPAFSLGCFQTPEAVLNLPLCQSNHISVVKRPTGGGALFHHLEMTYSVICNDADIQSRSVKDSYEILCGFLLSFYQALGLKVVFAKDAGFSGQLGQKSLFCLAGKELYDLTAEGRKLGGNAQRRKGRTILQHGSIPLSVNLKDINQYLTKPIPHLENQSLGLRDFGINEPEAVLNRHLKEAFLNTFKVQFRPCALAVNEKQRILDLEIEKQRKEMFCPGGLIKQGFL